MFERQIRLYRSDLDRVLPLSISHSNSRAHHRSSPMRSRSTSPNDMAIRQRRATVSSSPSISNALPVPASSAFEQKKKSNVESVSIVERTNEKSGHGNLHSTTVEDNQQAKKTILSCSNLSTSTVGDEPMDFKSRLAVFDRPRTNESTNDPSWSSINSKKPSARDALMCIGLQAATKPVATHPTLEKVHCLTEMLVHPAIRSMVSTGRAVTFYGGSMHNESTKLPMSIGTVSPTSLVPYDTSSIVSTQSKLKKSSIFSGMKKVLINIFTLVSS
jgi:hypothetical protein